MRDHRIRVKNVTQGVDVVDCGRVASTFFTRLRGLTGVRHLAVGDGLLIKPANSIHTHFMSIPLDILYLDKDDRVMDMDEQMAPWRFGRLRWRARAVLELPAGAAAACGIAVGDQLQITTMEQVTV